MRNDVLVGWLVGIAVTLAACGAKTPAPEGPSGGSVDWKSMSAGQRLEHMKKVVAPKMKAVFQAFDAEEFKDFNCATCHGEGAKAGRFDMPNPELPRLSKVDGFKTHMDTHPRETRFMMDKVVPEMAAALGMQPYDPATHQGFGCFDCHTEQK
jgi:hypothetical protein